MSSTQNLRSLMERTSAVLRQQAGDYLAQTVVGALLGALLLGGLAASMMGMFATQDKVTEATTVSAERSTMEAAFRQDVHWAANIPSAPATAQGFTAIVPGTGVDGACRVSTWIVDGTTMTNSSQTFEAAHRLPGDYTPGSESGSTGCTGALTAQAEQSWEVPEGTVFSFQSVDGADLTKLESKMFAVDGSTDPVRIEGVTYRSPTDTARTYQLALNLDQQAEGTRMDTRPVLDPNQNKPPARTDEPMVTVWNPSLQRDIYGGTHACQPDEYPLVLPLKGDVSVHVDWGDGEAAESVNAPYPFHCYDTGEMRTVTIIGTYTGWGERLEPLYGINTLHEIPAGRWDFIENRGPQHLLRQHPTWSSKALIAVNSWPEGSGTTDLSGAFYGAENLERVSTLPSGVTNLEGALAFTTKNIVGPVDWDTSNVTNMRALFYGATGFDRNLGDWRTEKVTDMSHMFNGASSFNSEITPWDTSNVTTMAQMFSGATAFDFEIAAWDVGKVKDMHQMFRDARSFNQSLGTWNPTSLTRAEGMFHGATSYNSPFLSQGLGNLKDFSHLFEHARAFNQPVGGLSAAAAPQLMNDMFRHAWVFNQPVGHLKTGSVTTMARTFQEARAFNQPVNTWNTGSVKEMGGMFSGSLAFNRPVGSWNTANVTDMSGMFHNTRVFNQPLATWNTGKVTTMAGMFSLSGAFNQPLEAWNMSQVRDISHMFNAAQKFNRPLNAWGGKLNGVRQMKWTFANTPVFNQPLGSWRTGNVVSMRNMFMNAQVFNQPLNGWDVYRVEDFSSTFAGAKVFNQPLPDWDVSAAKEAKSMFAGASAFNQDLSEWNLARTGKMNDGFAMTSGFATSPQKWPLAVRWQA